MSMKDTCDSRCSRCRETASSTRRAGRRRARLVWAEFELVSAQAVAEAQRHGCQVGAGEAADQRLQLRPHAAR